MERLEQRLASAQQAQQSFADALAEKKTVLNRDAAILRFQYTFEAMWKLLQATLKQEGHELGSPKQVIRESFTLGIIDEQQAQITLQMTNDRNLAVHTYNEKLAVELYAKLAQYCQTLAKTISRVQQYLKQLGGSHV